jgi:hypothetical protein
MEVGGGASTHASGALDCGGLPPLLAGSLLPSCSLRDPFRKQLQTLLAWSIHSPKYSTKDESSTPESGSKLHAVQDGFATLQAA